MMSNDTKINRRRMTRRKISSTSFARSPRVRYDRQQLISEAQGPRLCRRLASQMPLEHFGQDRHWLLAASHVLVQ